jgi:hypothetical protein
VARNKKAKERKRLRDLKAKVEKRAALAPGPPAPPHHVRSSKLDYSLEIAALSFLIRST